MQGLSNLFGTSNVVPASPPRRIAAGETAGALSLLLTHDGHPPDNTHIRHFIDFAAERGMDLTGMWVIARGPKLVAACLPVLAAGRSGLLLSSMPHRGADANITANCCRAAIDAMAPGTVLLQMLLEPAAIQFANALVASGFERLATLIYLQKSVKGSAAAACALRGYKLTRYSRSTHERFTRLIDATYAGSLDCPALHGRRPIEDVIAGHKSSGEFDPNLWFCLSDAADPQHPVDLGILLLAPLPGQETMEIVYLGLTPAARGKRLGDLLLDIAARETARHGEKYLTLAVDADNAPALRLYYRHGFGELQQRVALIRFLNNAI